MPTRLNSRTERLITMEHLLFRSMTGLRAVELAEACGVDRRTVYRDLTLLQEFGIPIYQKEGRFCINRERYMATVRLSYDEAVTLLLAASALSAQVAVQHEHFATAISKLSQALPEAVAMHAAYISELAKMPKGKAVNSNVLSLLTQAWGEQRKIKMSYAARDGSKSRTLEVSIYFIEPKLNGVIYVVGFDHIAKRIRAFKLNRIERVEILSSVYQTPSQFDPRRYLSRVRGEGKEEA